jgi:hypothetical protein
VVFPLPIKPIKNINPKAHKIKNLTMNN